MNSNMLTERTAFADHGYAGFPLSGRTSSSPPERYGFRTELTGKEVETGRQVRTTALLDPPVSFVANLNPPLEMLRCRA
ncbi:hypothetical protein OOK31_00705 [Streptomyces sp. NBC_00249]|uniref:hypothetical protein n=1 Tax=Streptomyces sp. NBC_00249 TaxID=2975690 RepID=UPI0022554859|nr:hypothetical protein [Streptomyces sp. NBC_00249]MCX5192419.1 hypothetical protein [Streptomyces sp. NBC_00249]